ncbi:hypothetical protein IC620_16455 [Hazenella sp. IB182357]|uniref:F5/8 type C domain-containing protein n=1 Tax=Polycladospora coralii TaxID=2771432 RepID=A0A926RVK1_9BACL|nr:hypothetical protein [Polycladospora coralii]MBD1373937.1 hypothetical protein [Polycladospora coralii]
MKKISIFMFTFTMIFGLFFPIGNQVNAASTDVTNESASNTVLLFSSMPDICIGGGRCGIYKYYQADLGATRYIDKVIVYAHDGVGSQSKAKLKVEVDGEYVDDLPVYNDGSFIRFDIGRAGRYVRFYSIHEDGDANGDETVIKTVDIYGQ